MPPRIHVCRQCFIASKSQTSSSLVPIRFYASAQAITPAASPSRIQTSIPPISIYPPTQPPSHRPPEFRRSQIHRQYVSLLRSSPLLIFFQHNNLKATEWTSVRRELSLALHKVDAMRAAAGLPDANLASSARLQVLHTGVFGAALRVVEYWRPDPDEGLGPQTTLDPTDPRSASSAETVLGAGARPTHGLSRAAHEAVKDRRREHALTPLLMGPLAALSLPVVSASHLAAALSVLSPQTGKFPAPTRRANPGYYELAVQMGIQKLLLLGARIEGRVLDMDGVRDVGGIEGGLEGLRARLVALLGGVGAGLVGNLERVGRSLYYTVEGRRSMLEEEGKDSSRIGGADGQDKS